MATVLTNVGEEHCVDRIGGTNGPPAVAQHIGWGTGAGTAAKGDTDLFTPATEARVSGTVSKNGSGAAAKYQVVGLLTADAGKTITNAGLFLGAGSGSPPSGGSLIIKGDFTGVVLALGDKIEFTVTLDPS